MFKTVFLLLVVLLASNLWFVECSEAVQGFSVSAEHIRRERQFVNTANWPMPFELRLVNGSSPNEGRVEVNYKGEWGTVCIMGAHNFIYTAKVICRQLGYPDAAEAKRKSFFGAGSGRVWIKPMCYGDEPVLDKCPKSWWGSLSDNCLSHAYDFGVVCSNTTTATLRLVGGSKPSEGRVEILHNGEWGSLCGRDTNLMTATVICRELGYREPLEITANASFGEGSGRIWAAPGRRCSRRITRVKTLVDCLNINPRQPYEWGVTNCNHSEDLGVVCSELLPVRLVNGSSPNEGRIEVRHQGIWGTICNFGRDFDVGTVVCRQLGYKRVEKMVDNPYLFGQGDGPVWLNPHCLGNESSLAHCNFFRWGVYSFWCNHSHDAGVICANDSNTRSLAPLATDESCNHKMVTLGVLIPVILVCVVVSVTATLVSVCYLCKVKQDTKAFSGSRFKDVEDLDTNRESHENDDIGIGEVPRPGYERFS